MTQRLTAGTALVLACWLALLLAAADSGAAACDVMAAGQRAHPDNACTPGAYRRLDHRQVCTPKDRRTISERVRIRILARYGLPARLPYPGKFDHRVPHFLGGTDDSRNVWPAPLRIFLKDRLETAVYRRVCLHQPRPMRVSTAIRIFLADWRDAYPPIVLRRGKLELAQGTAP